MGVPVPEALILKRAAPRDSLHVALYTRESFYGFLARNLFFSLCMFGHMFLPFPKARSAFSLRPAAQCSGNPGPLLRNFVWGFRGWGGGMI